MSTSTLAELEGSARQPAAGAAPHEQEILESKLRRPFSRAGLVTRDALVERLATSSTPIVAVVAPPGYGKTTLLGQWLARGPARSAWLSLDSHDNDPAVLLGYLAAALDRVEPSDPAVRRSLLPPAVVDVASSLHRLAVLVSSMRTPFTLVLDHVEVIQNELGRDAIAEIALNLPPGSRLALASRTEPPIPMARLRAQGAVTDLTVDDLAMDESEASQLLAAMDVALAPDDLSQLVARTEGWPVGLYLASLAIGAGGSGSGVGVAFRGDDRLMADYLRSEIVSALPPATRTFLTRTSVLDRLSGPLCDAVMGATGSQALLESLEASNLLLVPLDRRRQWYRCHHLLQELLRAELEQSEPALVARLHDRAAAWFEVNGQAALAIDHAQAAGDADRAARLFGQIAQTTHAAGRADTTLAWLSWFEARGLVREHPHVAVLGALLEAMSGHPASAERWAESTSSVDLEDLAPDGSPIGSWIAVMEACLCRHGVERMRSDAAMATERLTPTSRLRSPALMLQGIALLLVGDPDASDAALSAAVELSLLDGSPPSAALSMGERAVLAIGRNDWPAAEALASAAVDIVDLGHFPGYIHSTLIYAVAARSAARRGDVVRAKSYVALASRARPLCTAGVPFSAQFLIHLAHAYLELADPAGARAVLRQVRDILRVRPDLGVVADQCKDLERMLDTIRVGSVGASSLTAAELRLLPLLATHLSYRDIGERLHVSRNTVKSEAVSVFRKLGVSSRGDAVTTAEEIGLLGR